MTAGGADSEQPETAAVVHVEVLIHPHSTADYREVERHVRDYLAKQPPCLLISAAANRQLSDFKHQQHHHQYLSSNVESIRICECIPSAALADADRVRLQIYPHQLNNEPAVDEVEPDENIVSFREWTLPALDFVHLWESLVYDEDIPGRLLRYVQAAMVLSDRAVDQSLVSWNRVVLLHGPPGTGKTSLCKALAQKLAIRLGKSLFSKWFSESGKLVMRMFQHLTQIISDERAFVCLLIDEVESLAAARQCSSSEPSDSIRVVNAFLTQLDRLKSAKNLLVLTTSNICGSIDLAFIDRADIKQFIGLPGSRAIYSILSSSLNELLRAGVISTRRRVEFGGWMDASAVEMLSSLLEQSEPSSSPPLGAAKLAESPNDFSVQLWKISQLAGGLSGRMLRKLPFLAFASSNQFDSSLDLWDYLHLLRTAVERENADRTKLQS